tara:strand:+ start:7863 stop:9089 length:1227 start_codon:yes stop_codon:yes gene_type:complete
MNKIVKWLNKKESELLNLKVKENESNRNQARYYLTEEQWDFVLRYRTKPNKRKFVETQKKFDKDGEIVSTVEKLQSKPIDIPEGFEVIKISTSKTTGQQWIQYAPKKETPSEVVESFDFKSIIKKYIKPIKQKKVKKLHGSNDFDSLTFTDVHIGMDTDVDNNTMYSKEWNKEELFKTADIVINQTLQEQESSILYVDDLGDLLDGFNAQTTRGGHSLPQNMTNEESFDAALKFKLKILYGLVDNYQEIHFNNICNDNHSGAFGYFVNEAFKQIAELQFKNITVTNHRKFLNHYFVNDVCFIISHGKDDKSLKFGFKPHLDLKGTEKIDQYCKQNKIYKNSELVIFKKGDSHQALFDMCTSDDFYYYNYPALSPSSNWIKNNFKLGRRGFVNESFKGLKNYMKIHFIK